MGFAEKVHENKSFIQHTFRFRLADDGQETLRFLQSAFTFTHQKWSNLALPPIENPLDPPAVPFEAPENFGVSLLDADVADPMPIRTNLICPFCTEAFGSARALGIHEGQVHSTLLANHCYMCGQQVDGANLLGTHVALCELSFDERKPRT